MPRRSDASQPPFGSRFRVKLLRVAVEGVRLKHMGRNAVWPIADDSAFRDRSCDDFALVDCDVDLAHEIIPFHLSRRGIATVRRSYANSAALSSKSNRAADSATRYARLSIHLQLFDTVDVSEAFALQSLKPLPCVFL